MEKKALSGDAVIRLATPVVVWALTRLVEAPRVQKALKRVDKKTDSKAKAAKRNAKSNRAFVTAGAAALVLGLGLIARGAAKK
ncbi:MAG TPA: hypothetical protein VJ276_09780 [Thermoanaerobaculia bacterium]|nr:hypothetical protein [Thermoanaerobaculia bacterium]